MPTEPLQANTAAHLTKWSGCANGKRVWLITLDDWGHIWPGPYFTAKLKAGDPHKDFDIAEIIWEFFRDQVE